MAIHAQLRLCRRLRAMREQRGFSQAQVAEYLGISQASYSRMEKGVTGVTLTRMLALCTLYGITLHSMLEDF